MLLDVTLMPTAAMTRIDRVPLRVLVVDDDDAMRALLRRILERQGHRVVDRSRGDRVLDALDSDPVDVVILDKEMPGLSGLDLLPLLRRRYPDIPVIIITAFGGTRVAGDALRLGAARYLEKPFRLDELMEAIHLVARPPARNGD